MQQQAQRKSVITVYVSALIHVSPIWRWLTVALDVVLLSDITSSNRLNNAMESAAAQGVVYATL